jgi:HEAT repeat protein
MGTEFMALSNQEWNDLLEKLRGERIPTEGIGSAIVRLGKPFDRERIQLARDVVARYLSHEDAWVRHEAMWFLTSWGRLHEYESALIHAMKSDSDIDNRFFAASWLGVLGEERKSTEAIRALRDVLEDTQQDELVRKVAYRSLLDIAKPRPARDFTPHENGLCDVDWTWVSSLRT